MIDGAVIWGGEEECAAGIAELFALGATEVLASPRHRRPRPDRIPRPHHAPARAGGGGRQLEGRRQVGDPH